MSESNNEGDGGVSLPEDDHICSACQRKLGAHKLLVEDSGAIVAGVFVNDDQLLICATYGLLEETQKQMDEMQKAVAELSKTCLDYDKALMDQRLQIAKMKEMKRGNWLSITAALAALENGQPETALSYLKSAEAIMEVQNDYVEALRKMADQCELLFVELRHWHPSGLKALFLGKLGDVLEELRKLTEALSR